MKMHPNTVQVIMVIVLLLAFSIPVGVLMGAHSFITMIATGFVDLCMVAILLISFVAVVNWICWKIWPKV